MATSCGPSARCQPLAAAQSIRVERSGETNRSQTRRPSTEKVNNWGAVPACRIRAMTAHGAASWPARGAVTATGRRPPGTSIDAVTSLIRIGSIPRYTQVATSHAQPAATSVVQIPCRKLSLFPPIIRRSDVSCLGGCRLPRARIARIAEE